MIITNKDIIFINNKFFEYNGNLKSFSAHFKEFINKILKEYYKPLGKWGKLNDPTHEGVINTGIDVSKYLPNVIYPSDKEIKDTYILFHGLIDMIWSLFNFLDTNYSAKAKLINGLNILNGNHPEKIIDLLNKDIRSEFIKLVEAIIEHKDRIIYPTYGINTQPCRDIMSSIIKSHTSGEITARRIYDDLEQKGYKVELTLDGQLEDIEGGIDLKADNITLQNKPFSSCFLTPDNRYKVITKGMKDYKVDFMAFYNKETNEILYFKIKDGDMGISKKGDFCTFSYDCLTDLKKPILTF